MISIFSFSQNAVFHFN